MSCYGIDYDYEEEEPCQDCGRDKDEPSCEYSKVECETCGWSPCDESC